MASEARSDALVPNSRRSEPEFAPEMKEKVFF